MIPSFEEFMFPVLYVLGDGKPLHRDALKDACAKYMGFSEEELQEKVKSGLKYKITDRLQWATFYLMKAGLINRTEKATEQITDEGRQLLKEGVVCINRQFLRSRYQALREFEAETRLASRKREKAKSLSKNVSKVTGDKSLESSNKLFVESPKEPAIFEEKLVSFKKLAEEKEHSYDSRVRTLNHEVGELTNGLIEELKGIVSGFDKDVFRRLLLDLFPKMGYTSIWEACDLKSKMEHEVLLSGFLNFDELGMSRILVVAHNNVDEEISSLDVQSFIGTLTSMGVSQGVYITTSTFTSEAIECQQLSSSTRCVLIDGVSLAKLMIKHNVGVVVRKIFEIKDVDQEYLFTQIARPLDP